MKASLTTAGLCLVFALSIPVHAQESAPILSISDAIRSAQALLDQQKLPMDYFIRSITLTESPGVPGSEQYEARFEPTKTQRIKVGSDPEPVKYQVIVVTMDGNATIEERVITSSRRKMATRDSTEPGTNR